MVSNQLHYSVITLEKYEILESKRYPEAKFNFKNVQEDFNMIIFDLFLL